MGVVRIQFNFSLSGPQNFTGWEPLFQIVISLKIPDSNENFFSIAGIGDVGDVISVMAVYAREHLLLPKKAEYATPENVKKYTALKKVKIFFYFKNRLLILVVCN